MIRRGLKRIVRRLLSGAEPASDSPPPPLPDPPPSAQADSPPPLEIDGDELAEWMASSVEFDLLDIRELHEVRHGHARDARLIPMNQVPDRLEELPARERRLLVYCAAGFRSHGVVSFLREEGWADAWSLIGGLSAYAAVGGPVERPPPEAAFPPASRVVADDLQGTVQRIHSTEEGPRYTVAVLRDGERIELHDLPESALRRP